MKDMKDMKDADMAAALWAAFFMPSMPFMVVAGCKGAFAIR
jgi:hypothetical protein